MRSAVVLIAPCVSVGFFAFAACLYPRSSVFIGGHYLFYVPLSCPSCCCRRPDTEGCPQGKKENWQPMNADEADVGALRCRRGASAPPCTPRRVSLTRRS